ncbi:MAG: hypothetical protein PHP22_02170 [Oscillospiraceae bacterium]|nr:hypothetical protein [Oscillospiraceae bacterium]
MDPKEKDLNGGVADETLSQEVIIINDKPSAGDIAEQIDEEAASDIEVLAELTEPVSVKKKLPISTIVLSVLCVALAVVLLLTQFGVIGTLRKSSATGSADWFSTPEESIRYFVESVRDNHFDLACTAFAGEEIAPEAQFVLQLERVGSYNPLAQYSMPEQYAAYSPALLAVSQGKSAGSTLQFAASLLLGEDYMQQNTFSTEPETARQEITAIAGRLDPKQLKGLTFVRADVIDANYQNSEEYKSFIKKRVEAFGYDSYSEYMALVKLGDTSYVAMFAMVSDNGKWKIYEMNSGLLQFSYAIAIPISEEDYLKMI